MAKVFVGNFSFSVNDAQLKEYFSKVGSVVSAKVMTEGQGGRSRGFGFVEFATAEEARKAMTELDGSVWEGRAIKVSEDRSMRRSGDSFERGGDREGGYEQGGDEGSRPSPLGYFRAQPLDIGIRKKKKLDPFLEDPKLAIDYKDPRLLAKFISERGRILPRRMTGLTSYHQRQISRAIKRAQQVGLMPTIKS